MAFPTPYSRYGRIAQYVAMLAVFISPLLVCSCIDDDVDNRDISQRKDWTIRSIDHPVPHVIADVRGDGVIRTYAVSQGSTVFNPGTKTSELFEYTYSENRWEATKIFDSNISGYAALAGGVCRPDGIMRLYLIPNDGSVIEFEYRSGNWIHSVIHTTDKLLDSSPIIKCGDTDTDGIQSILFIYYGPSVQELTELVYVNDAWKVYTVETATYEVDPTIGDFEIGTLKNGHPCIYTINHMAKLYEHTKDSGSFWTATHLETLQSVPDNGINLGFLTIPLQKTGSNTPSLIVYSGVLHSLHYENDSLIKQEIVTSIPEIRAFGYGDLRGDGIVRVYSVGTFAYITEFTQEGTEWVETDQIRNETNALTNLTIGPGRNDGVDRMYIQQFLVGNFEVSFKPR